METFQLLNGEVFNYAIQLFDDAYQNNAFALSYVGWKSANGYTGYYGEWYNGLERGMTFKKMTDAELTLFLSTH